MKKRQLKKHLKFKKVSVSNFLMAKGGGTHYEHCKTDYTQFPKCLIIGDH